MNRLNRSRVLSLLYVAPFLGAVLALFWPVILGQETLFVRDVFNTHLEMKTFQAEAMRSGELPLVDPYRSGGQPHLGNPNTVPLYPDNLLYLVGSTIWSFNAHFWLHLLLAPLAVAYLGRQVGLGRLAAWSAGVFYATSGYYLSTLNLYNLTAATTLTPAFIGACVQVGRDRDSNRGVVVAAGLWTLLVLGGDPMTAVVAALAGSTAGLLSSQDRGATVLRLGVVAALGTLIAAPQVVEFLRIVPGSYRGIQGYSVEAATAASWSPGNLFEWLMPMAFGYPDLLYWGDRFHAGRLPLLYSFYPGLMALALAVVGTRRSRPWVAFGWALVGVGIFFAMGSYNPVASWLLGLPGMKIFRLPVKLWVLVGCGLALLAGLGFQRLLDGDGERRLRRILLGLLIGFALLGLALGLAGDRAAEVLGGWMPARIPASHAATEVGRWLGLCVASAALLVVALVLFPRLVGRGGGWRRSLAGGFLLATHVAGQVAFLAPLVPTDSVAAYSGENPLLDEIPVDARVVHGDAGSLFGPTGVDPADYPDASLRWLQRDTFEQLYPPAGTLARRRYDFWSSPEGLDSFLTRAITQALPVLDDPNRLSLLEASGVTHLLLGRDLEGVSAERAERLLVAAAGTASLRLYRLRRSPPEAQFVGRVLRADDPRQAVRLLTDSTFDPREATVLGGDEAPLLGGRGRAEVIESTGQAISVRVHAETPGAVVFQRSFLPIYSAELNGEPVEIALANLHRMAVKVPAGEHRIDLGVDSGSLRPSFLLSALGVILLVMRGRRRSPDSAKA